VNFAIRRREPSRVDVTPLIDIIFQLVLFFMVSTTFVTSPGIQVDLPRSSAQTIIREKQDISVWMTAEGTVYVDREPMTWDVLEQRFDVAAMHDPNTMVIIKADTDVDHGRVVAIMDLARARGLARLAIATEVSGESTTIATPQENPEENP
jgi:biopolymer transport protein ExbD/biopolymer transport protein TolR